jgi:hypothetical protein
MSKTNQESPMAQPNGPKPLASWLRPSMAAIGLGFMVGAIGGPGSLGNLSSISAQFLTATAASALGGVGLALLFTFRPYWTLGGLMRWLHLSADLSAPTPTRRVRPARMGIGLGIGGAAVLLVTVLRLMIGSAPLLGPIIWGFFGGFMLAGSVMPTKALVGTKR